MGTRKETQYAIRLKESDGYRYEQYRDNGPGGQISHTRLNLKTAKDQLSLYTASSEPTVVTQTVIIEESGWVEVETSEVKQLAELLHTKQCRYNHIDQCDWGYGGDRSIYKEYEAKAKKLLEKVADFEQAKAFLEIL